MLQAVVRTRNDVALTVIRIALGLLFFVHGSQKVFGWFGGFGFPATMQYFASLSIPYGLGLLAIAAEFLGGIGLIVGLLSRVAAFGVTCVMLGAIATVHAQFGPFMNWAGTQKGEGYEFHLLVIAMALVMMLRGGGAASIDLALTREPDTSSSRP